MVHKSYKLCIMGVIVLVKGLKITNSYYCECENPQHFMSGKCWAFQSGMAL